MFIDFDEIEEDQNTQGPITGDKIMKIIHHVHSEHIRTKKKKKKKHTRQIWTLIYVPKHYNEGLHSQEHMITEG